jgi:hypothetical protein
MIEIYNLNSGGDPCHVGQKNGEPNRSGDSAKSVGNFYIFFQKLILDCSFFVILAQLFLMFIQMGIVLYFISQGL